MICRQCGNALAGTARFCGKCGTVVFSQEAETETAVLTPPAGSPVWMPPGPPPGMPPGMPPHMAVPQPPAGLPPGQPPGAGYPQAPMGATPGFGPRPSAPAGAKGNAGIVIGLCALAALALALTGYWAYTKLSPGGGGGETATPARLYPLMAMDMTKERTRATGESDVLPIVLISDGLTEVVPYSEGWGLQMTWDLAMVLGLGNLPECMTLTRNRTERMWVNRDGRIIRSPETSPMVCQGALMPARPAQGGALCGYADAATLKFRIPPTFQACEPFADGRALVTKEGKMQYIDATGKTVIAPNFTTATSFSEGLAAVRSVQKNKLGYIDLSGNYVIKDAFRVGSDFHEGLAAVEMEPSGLLGFIDRSGQSVIGPKYRELVCDFRMGRAVVKNSDRVVLIDKSGKELAEWADNRTVTALGEGMFAVKYGDETILVDRNGKTAGSGKYRQVFPYQMGYAVAIGTDQSYLLDRSGREVLKAGRTMLGQYGGRYLTRLSQEKGIDLIDPSGTPQFRLEKGVLTRNPKP